MNAKGVKECANLHVRRYHQNLNSWFSYLETKLRMMIMSAVVKIN